MQERISGYQVYDRGGEKIGKVDDLFVDENDEPEYIGVKTGLLGSKSTLIPIDLVRINDEHGLIEVSEDKDRIKDAPTFGKDEEITSEYEDSVYRHFGLQGSGTSDQRSSYGDYYSDPDRESSRETRADDRRDDESSSRSEGRDRNFPDVAAGTGERGSDERGSDERESSSSGGARVRKRMRIPVQREEVHVDRIRTDSGEEELRIRKEMVQDEEVVEIPEGVDGVSDETERRDG